MTQRFWRFKSDEFPGRYTYIDPAQIISVSYEKEADNNGDDSYVVCLASGDEFYLNDDDGLKLMRWAEANATDIPESAQQAMAWK